MGIKTVGQIVLDLPMQENDSGSDTVREYLVDLVRMLWQEGESFSGKRPFGNSGWEYDLYKPLLVAEMVDGKLDSEGYIDTVDERAAVDLINQAIDALLA